MRRIRFTVSGYRQPGRNCSIVFHHQRSPQCVGVVEMFADELFCNSAVSAVSVIKPPSLVLPVCLGTTIWRMVLGWFPPIW